MNKTIILLLALIPVMLASTCADIPSFKKLKEQAGSLNSDKLNSAISTFESASPAKQTGLDFCADFNDKTGCCTQDFISAAKDAIEKSTEKLKAKKPIFGILLKQLDQAIKRCKKGGNQNQNQNEKQAPPPQNQPAGKKALLRQLEVAAENQTAPSDKNPNDDKQFVAEYKKCQIKIIQATRKFKRGAFCTLCIDPASISTYFNDDGTLKMDTAAFEQYKTEMGEGFKCMSDFNDKFIAKAKEATDLLDANACPKIQEKIQAQLDAFKQCSGDQCLTAWLDKVRLFGDNVAESVTVEESQYTNDINANRRVLATYGDISPVSGGFKSYIADQSDNSVSIDGVTLETEGQQMLNVVIAGVISLIAVLLF